MTDLSALYQEMILDHYKRPRNFKRLEPATHHAEGMNPLCGDQLELFVRLDDGDRIAEIGFQGSGCAISQASASIMTETVKGRSRAEAVAAFEVFHRLVTGRSEVDLEDLGKLAVFSTVSRFPVRIKCASLAWHTLRAALEGSGEARVTTE